MVFAVASAVAGRRIGMLAKQTAQRRTMASGAPAPEWEGIDKVVRGYFPQDYQLSMAILGGYFGLFTLYKIKSAISGGGKTEEAAPVAVASVSTIATTGIPPVDTPEFDKYLETDSFYKMLDSDEQLGKVVEDMK